MVKVKENLEFQTIICPVTVIGWGAQGCLQLAGGDLAICAPATHLSLAYCLHLEFPGLTGEYDLARCQQNKYKVHQDQGSEYSIACIGEGDQLTKEQVYPCCRTISSNPVTIHRVIRGRLGSPRQNVEQKKAGGGHLGATMKGGSSRKAPPHDPLPSTRRLSQTSLQQVFTSSNTSRHLCQKLMYL